MNGPTYRKFATRLARMSAELERWAVELKHDRPPSARIIELARAVDELRHSLAGKRDPLPEGQRSVFEYLKRYISQHDFAPSRAEIADALGFSSVNAAQDHLDALASKGWVEIEAHTERGITLRPDIT